MATLIERDSSGVLQAQDGETVDLRTRAAIRHLVSENGDGTRTYRIGATIGPLHYNEDVLDETGAWLPIDLDLLPVR